MAAARELAEEVGIHVDADQFDFVGVTHHLPPHRDSRVGFGFVTTHWTGEPKNMEPEKCAQLAWFAAEALPDLTMEYTAEIVRLYRRKEVFSLHGWGS